MTTEPIPTTTTSRKNISSPAVQGTLTTDIDFDDILAQSFGPLDALGRITKNLACSDVASADDVLSLGYIIEALHNYGTTRFMELLTQAEKNAVRQGVGHV